MSRLRSQLAAVEPGGDEALVTEPDGYRVDLATFELDSARFEELVARAETVIDADPGAAVTLLEEAEGLWRGAAYGELAVHERVRAEAMRLERLRAKAAADRTDAQLALGRHSEVIGEVQARVAADPLGERAHGQLMVALYRSARQAEALSTYRALQERLAEELGVDPSPALQTLHERMLRQDPGLAAPPRHPSGDRDRLEVREHRGGASMPAMGAGMLFGRDDDVRLVASLVAEASLVTLTGPGGVGKTRLAEQAAAEVAARFDDGVISAALASVRDPASVAPALVGALGILGEGGRAEQERLVAALGTRRLLLVLDNCEHLLEAVSPLVESILRRCPNVAILTTSREPLRVPGERVWQVAPLPVPRPGASAATVAQSPAGALFCARAAAATPDFELTDHNADAVAELCRRVDGMPLAIELAAARVRAMSPADLLERLSDRFELLRGGPHREGGRHRTLHRVVMWSYELLTESEARLFDRLSVFAGPFPLEAAEQVAAGEGLHATTVAGVLAELVDKSIVSVKRDDGAVRYWLLRTLRDFGAERLAESGQAEAGRRAHADYHVAVAERLSPRVRGPGEGAAVAEIEATVDDLRVAHGWLVTAADVDGALRLSAALCDYVFLRVRDEMITWAERAVELRGAPAHPAYPIALATTALGATHRGELDRARLHAESALARAEPASVAALWALSALRIAALFEGCFDDALALDDRTAEVADALDEDYYRAVAGVDRVLAHLYRGDAVAARRHAARLEEAAQASGNPTMRAWAHYCHGEALLDTDPDQAVRRLETAVDVARSVGSRLPEGVALVSLASLCGRRGDTDRALGLFREVVTIWRRLGDYSHQITTLRNLVDVLTRVRADEAAAVLHSAVTAASTPTFGAEADRLAAAWVQLEQRMSADAAQAAASRGRGLTLTEAANEALATLDALLGG